MPPEVGEWERAHAQEPGRAGPLTVLRLVGQPAVLGILVDIVGVALGTLLGPEVLVGPRTVFTVADLVLKHGPCAWAASVGWTAVAERPGDPAGREGWEEGSFLHETWDSSVLL